MSALLELHHLTIQYPGTSKKVIQDLSFSLAEGEIACLLGPSGCGKTSVLRAIAGFLQPNSGEIRVKGQSVNSYNTWVAPEKRGIGVVFQDYALFPHLTVGKNIGFGLTKLAPPQREKRVAAMLDLVGLTPFAQRFPHELSGGQQQRVALARALAPQPSLILLDEPFSNLDVELREKLSHEVRDILKAAGMTAILVTHDQYEAFAMADSIGVLQEGHLAQWDEPYRLYHEPASRAVADFIGQGVFVEGRLTQKGVEIELGSLKSPLRSESLDHGKTLDVLLRPDDITHDDASELMARVKRKSFRGADFLYTLETEGGMELLALVPSHHNHAIGEKIGIRLDVDHVVAFPKRNA
jgi:iron(III) transport system ATP-binding protein